ncbi:MAG: T9SS type A sorting domain-containing protein [Saprospiraceae bacterium]
MRKWNWLLACLLAVQNLAAQMVETVASHPKIVDGIHVDAAGNVYTAPGGLMGGTAIGKATSDGNFDPNFRTGFNGPIDIDENSDGIFFVTNYDNNTLKSYNPATDELTTILTGLDGPAGLTLDGGGNIFLTCFGAPPAYSGKQVIKVKPDGSSEVWLETSDFFRPQGITFDDEGFLWVANTPTGKIFKIDTMTKLPVLVFELGNKVGNLVFRKKDHQLYFPSQGNHRIYRMDLQGNLDTLAGAGSAGSMDGDALSAQFNKPLGLGFTASEDTLYVSEAGKLRRITQLDGEPSQATGADRFDLKLYPNPSAGAVKLEFPKLNNGQLYTIAVFDTAGKEAMRFSTYEATFTLNGLEKGTWYIRLFVKDKMVSEKVIVF